MSRRFRLALGTLAVAGVLVGVAGAASVANGNFETGTLSSWTVNNVGSGNWFNYTGTTSPFSGFTIAAPPEGTRAAVTDQGGPGRHILYQDVALEADFDHTLSLIVYYRNRAGAFFSPPTLDPFSSGPNQQYRIDIMKPSAPIDSVLPTDVLLNVFRTLPGDPLTKAPTTITADLSPFDGQTVRIRFAEVDNQSFFQASTDAVSITSLPLEADLSVVKTGPSLVQNGTDLTYSITVTNGGSATATNVTVTDAVPAGTTYVSSSAGCTQSAGIVTCTVASLASGGSATFTITVHVAAASGSTVCNTARAGADQPDPNTANNSSTTCATVTPGKPATLVLTPATDTNTVGDQHCVTATVLDAFGNPTPGITVRFSVSGSVTTSGSATTNAAGQAQFCYTGPALPGADVITAFADTDGDNVRDADEPQGTAAKTWVLPGSTEGCKVTYGGRITAANGDKATFGGNAKADGLTGQEEYQDHGPAADMNVHSIDVLSVVCSRDGTQASIFGTATIDGSGPYNYRIDLKDLGEPGSSDTYRIRLSNGYDSLEQVLNQGNVQIHK